MGERAAHLVDGVLGGVPVRQWVLTLPFRLRDRLAYDHRLCRAVLGVFVRALLGFEQRWARAGDSGPRRGGHGDSALRSALNVNPHFHTLAAEGVFEEQPDGSHHFVPLREPPSDVEVARLLAAVRGRILRLLRLPRRPGDAGVARDHLSIALCAGAGRVAPGTAALPAHRAGAAAAAPADALAERTTE
jgi:hypothetical protein